MIASGSLLASKTASLKIESAPIGVLSSCEIFATKSRLIESNLRISLSSKIKIAINPASPIEDTRTKRSWVPAPIGPLGNSMVASCCVPLLRTALIRLLNSLFKIRSSFIRLNVVIPSE